MEGGVKSHLLHSSQSNPPTSTAKRPIPRGGRGRLAARRRRVRGFQGNPLVLTSVSLFSSAKAVFHGNDRIFARGSLPVK